MIEITSNPTFIYIFCFVAGTLGACFAHAVIQAANEGVTTDEKTGIRYPRTKVTSEDKQLYKDWGLQYLKRCKEEMLDAQKSENYYKKEYEYIQKQHDCALLLLDEYFAQDQTNDDLLVLALEAIQRCASARLVQYSDEEKAEMINAAVNKMNMLMTVKDKKHERNSIKKA